MRVLPLSKITVYHNVLLSPTRHFWMSMKSCKKISNATKGRKKLSNNTRYSKQRVKTGNIQWFKSLLTVHKFEIFKSNRDTLVLRSPRPQFPFFSEIFQFFFQRLVDEGVRKCSKISTKRVLPHFEKINLLPGGLRNTLDRFVSNQKPGETDFFSRKIPKICQKSVQIRSNFC